MVHRFITQGTFEKKINTLLQNKKELAELAVASGEQWIGELGNAELRELVRRERNTYAILWALFEQYCVARRSRSSGYAPFSRLVLPKNNLTLLPSYFVTGALVRLG